MWTTLNVTEANYTNVYEDNAATYGLNIGSLPYSLHTSIGEPISYLTKEEFTAKFAGFAALP
ncbi:hypothetical protein N8470_00630 [bacterium]|nr:hypothetical protein [bacterium]